MSKWKTPPELKYTKTDEWLRIEGDTGIIGITDYAQDQLNDVVFLELPEVGALFDQGVVLGVIGSVKAASDQHVPVCGEITEVNSSAENEPDNANIEPCVEACVSR